jgi:hypothetical protein
VSLAVKPVGKPDAGNPHVRFDERGWETGRRSGVSARAHPRLYKLPKALLGHKKGGPEEPPALSFAVMPQKHAYIGCDSGHRPPFIINRLR